jgi:hypothetical protein
MRLTVVSLAVSAGIFTVLSSAALAQTAPPGWKTEQPSNGVTVFTPSDLQAGEVYTVTVYDSEALEGKSLDSWLTTYVGRASVSPGKLLNPLKMRTSENVVAGTGVFQKADGTGLGAIFLGVSADSENVHLTRILFSGQKGLSARYKAQTEAITNAVVAKTKREAGGKVAKVPSGLPSGMKRGGALQPGVYAGNQYRGEELGRRFRIHLYENGEYRVCDQNDKDYDYNTGQVQYNPNNGKLTISRSFDMVNPSAYEDEDFCYYGRDAQGKPFIYAENDHGVSVYRTTLRYVGPSTRPSASAEEETKARAEAEAKRYKWVTPAGKGVQPAQIAAIVHNYKVEIYSAGLSGMGTNVTDDAYLLLKDGTIHDGLPVAPDQLDVPLSRRREPEKWGRWKAQGNGYLVSWASGGGYKPLPGKRVLPGKAGQRLQGRWGAGSSSADIAGSSYRLWGVTFTRDGRFTKDNRGGSANSTFMQTGGQPAINSSYDDNGSSTSVSGGHYTIQTGKKKNPNGNREGTYSIDGYTLTLRYDNGQVARMPFFFSDNEHKSLWFEGNRLDIDEETKK